MTSTPIPGNARQTAAAYLVPAVVIALAVYLLTPRGWEPGGESWTAWAAARTLADTGGFPVFSRNVLFAGYLTIFLQLPFPWSVVAEFWVTHLFALGAIYALVRASLDMPKALLLVVALTPTLVVMEGAGTVAAVGFFSLYLRTYVTAGRDIWPVLPPSLLAAALCHSAYMPFAALHLLVSAGFFIAGKWRKTDVRVSGGQASTLTVTVLLLVFAVVAMAMQSGRIDNNHMLMDPRFAPIPLNSAINIGFFQISTWELAEKIYDPATLWSRDWYFETPVFFGGAKTILEVLRGDPALFFRIVTEEIGYTVTLPLYFYSFFPIHFFHYASVLTVPAALLMLWLGLARIYRAHGIHALLILTVGGGGLIAAFLLTSLNDRYMVTFLPIFLLAYTGFIGETAPGTTTRLRIHPALRNTVFIAGCLMVLANAPFGKFSARVGEECNAGGEAAGVGAKARRFVCSKVKGAEYQLRAVAANEGFLLSDDGVSLLRVRPRLAELIGTSTRVLSKESTFLAAFTAVGLDHNLQIWSLPPFADRTEYSSALLNSVDVFLVSDTFAAAQPSLSTQSYLRYSLHVLPYLTANKEKFRLIPVPRFGSAYVRKDN